MSNYITDIQLSGVTYTLSAQTSGGSEVVTITQSDYVAGNNLCGNKDKTVKIQNGYENYSLADPQKSQSIAYNWYNGVSKDSFVLGVLGMFVKVVENNQVYYPFDLTKQEIVNGGLEGIPMFFLTKTKYTASMVSNAIIFKPETTFIALEDNYIDFYLEGKIYFDEACTKEYRSNPSWSMSGSATKSGGTWTGSNFYFSAPQLEDDGFFSRTDSSKMGKIYDENGNTSNIYPNILSYRPSGNGKIGDSEYIYCLQNTNGIAGDYYSYVSLAECVNTKPIRFGTNNYQYYSTEFGAIDYSKLDPSTFTYYVDESSTDSKGTGGIRYIQSGGTMGRLSIILIGYGNYSSYSLVEGVSDEVVYHDEPVDGVYSIKVLEDGSRILTLDDAALRKHQKVNFDRQGYAEILQNYYVHYMPKPSITYDDIDRWNSVSGKQETLSAGTGIEISGNVISVTGGSITSGEVQTMINESISGKADTSSLAAVATSGDYDDLTNKPTIPTVPTNVSDFANDAGYATSGYVDSQVSGKVDSATVETMISEATSGLVDSSAITSAITSASTDFQIPTAKAVYDAIPNGGTGGGKTISAGTNISVTTGETTDTINCTLPISTAGGYPNNFYTLKLGKGNNTVANNSNSSLVCGGSNTLNSNNSLVAGSINNCSGDNSFVCGYFNSALKSYTLIGGGFNEAYNRYEFASGLYNNSVSASETFGDSGNTLFSVGNGTSLERHNAFEIRQNGDIYITSGGTDIKLQDNLGGASGGIDSGTVESMISAATSGLQETLVAGSNIAISGNVISAQLEGGTVSKGEVEDMIDAATSGLAESSAVTVEISAATSGKVDTTAYTAYTAATEATITGKANASDVYTKSETYTKTETDNSITAAVSGKADTSAVTAINDTLTGHTADTTIHVTSSDKITWSGKQDALQSGVNIKTINNESILGSGNITISGGGGGSGATVTELTQAQYDALVSAGTVDSSVLYVITDAEEINANEYVTKASNVASGYTKTIEQTNTWQYSNGSITDFYVSADTNCEYVNIYYGIADYTCCYYQTLDFSTVPTFAQDFVVATYDSATRTYHITNTNTEHPYFNDLCISDYGGSQTFKLWVYEWSISSGQSANVLNESLPQIADNIDNIKSKALKEISINSNTGTKTDWNYYGYRLDGTQTGWSGFRACDGKGIVNDGGLKLGNIQTVEVFEKELLDENDCTYYPIGGSWLSYVDSPKHLVMKFNTNFYTDSQIDINFAYYYDGGANSNWKNFSVKNNNGTFEYYLNGEWTTDYSAVTSDFQSYTNLNITATATGIEYVKASGQTEWVAMFNVNYCAKYGNDESSPLSSVTTYDNSINIYDAVDTLYANYESGASSAVTSGDTNAVSSDAVYTQLGGLKLQQISQADYDALVSGGTVDNSTLYIIVNNS